MYAFQNHTWFYLFAVCWVMVEIYNLKYDMRVLRVQGLLWNKRCDYEYSLWNIKVWLSITGLSEMYFLLPYSLY
jgi:hypothetical protein